MKKDFLIGLGAALAGMLGAACGRQSSGTALSHPPIVLIADSITIGQIFIPWDWAVSRDRAVVQSAGTDSVFYVYSLPDFRFLYTWGSWGEGPDEFMGVSLANASYGDTGEIVLYDSRRKSFRTFGVTDGPWEQTDSVPLPSVRASFNLLRALPHRFVGEQRIDWEKQTEYLYVCAPGAQGGLTDSLALKTWLESRQSSNGGGIIAFRRWNPAEIVVRGDKIAVMYRNFSHIDFYRLSPQGRLSFLSGTGEPIPDDALSQVKEMQTGFMAFSSTEKHLYALRVTSDPLENETSRPSIGETRLYAYDWTGRLARVYALDHPATDILVTADGKYLYTHNVTEDFDRVYRYALR